MRWARLFIWSLALGAISLPHCSGAEVKVHRFVLSAEEAFENGQGAWGVKRTTDGALGLYDRVLVEDDGPGIGSDAWWMKTDRAPTTEISGNTRVKKVLHIERADAKEARLYVPENVTIEFNGEAIKASASNSFPEIPINLLKEGDNEVVLYNSGNKRQHIKIALPEDILRNAPDRKDRPRRSFKSVDGGKSWVPIDGEYLVRLHLIQYLPQGHFISQAIDLGKERKDGNPLGTPVSIQSVSLPSAKVETPEGTRVEVSMRSGPSPVYDPALWTDWRPAGTAAVPAKNRYLQWKATLYSYDPLKTPLLRSITLEAKVTTPGMPVWAKELKTISFQNEEIRYTSMPFEYENPLHPRLAALRQKYKLDEIISGAATETEQMVRLRDWVAHQWNYQPPEENYPAWDADEILTRKCGFCVQYAIVMMQCATSLGHQARFVFGHNPGAFDAGGHEVCEIWSDEHRKWIFYDVNQDWHYIDPSSKTPMSMLEVHDVLMKTYYHGEPATLANAPQERKPFDAIAICYGTNMIPGLPPAEFERHYTNGHYTVPTRWLFMNYVPRNNFFAKQYPLPKTQGTHWDWSDYWCWEDALTPKEWQYRNFTARRNDLNWTLNQVRFDATISDRPGALAIQMGTSTPFFDTFLVKVDQQNWTKSSKTFKWQLHPGSNRAEMKVRAQPGIEGPVSFLELKY